jgi:hypothetical protein
VCVSGGAGAMDYVSIMKCGGEISLVFDWTFSGLMGRSSRVCVYRYLDQF